MQRRMIAGLVLTLTSTLFIVFGTMTSAHAEINRCGLAYTTKSAPQSLYYDESPSIQPYRLRLKPATPRDVCIEFLAVKSGWETKGHIIRFHDYQGAPAAKICGVNVCRWHSDDDRFFVSVKLYARPKNQGAEWKEYTGETVFVIG